MTLTLLLLELVKVTLLTVPPTIFDTVALRVNCEPTVTLPPVRLIEAERGMTVTLAVSVANNTVLLFER